MTERGPRIIATGTAASRGIKKGVVVNIGDAAGPIRDAVDLIARLREAGDTQDGNWAIYDEAADALEAQGHRLAEAERDAARWQMMERPYIGGYEKGPNPSYLCRHRYRLADCITCLNEHLATEQKP